MTRSFWRESVSLPVCYLAIDLTLVKGRFAEWDNIRLEYREKLRVYEQAIPRVVSRFCGLGRLVFSVVVVEGVVQHRVVCDTLSVGEFERNVLILKPVDYLP
jgi:hypothetical protein